MHGEYHHLMDGSWFPEAGFLSPCWGREAGWLSGPKQPNSWVGEGWERKVLTIKRHKETFKVISIL